MDNLSLSFGRQLLYVRGRLILDAILKFEDNLGYHLLLVLQTLVLLRQDYLHLLVLADILDGLLAGPQLLCRNHAVRQWEYAFKHILKSLEVGLPWQLGVADLKHLIDFRRRSLHVHEVQEKRDLVLSYEAVLVGVDEVKHLLDLVANEEVVELAEAGEGLLDLLVDEGGDDEFLGLSHGAGPAGILLEVSKFLVYVIVVVFHTIINLKFKHPPRSCRRVSCLEPRVREGGRMRAPVRPASPAPARSNQCSPGRIISLCK